MVTFWSTFKQNTALSYQLRMVFFALVVVNYMGDGLDDGAGRGLGGIELFVATVVDVVVWSGAARVVPWERS